MLRRLILVLSLITVFGLGQQAVAVHAISHLADAEESSQHKQAPHSQSCEKCVVYAQLGGALQSSGFVLPPATSAHVAHDVLTLSADSASHLFYSARAPPLLA